MWKQRRGFTLVELLVVITIIGILVSMTVPAVMSARENGRKVQCASNITNVIKAMINYESTNGCFPPGRVGCDDDMDKPPANMPDACQSKHPAAAGSTNYVFGPLLPYEQAGTSGFALILPQLDEMSLYASFNGFRNGAVFPGGAAYSSKGTGSSTWTSGFSEGSLNNLRPPGVFVCPSDILTGYYYSGGTPSWNIGASSVAMCMGSLGPRDINSSNLNVNGKTHKCTIQDVKYRNDGAFIYRRGISSNAFLDGLSNTIFLGETVNGNQTGRTNRWCIGWAYLDSLRGGGYNSVFDLFDTTDRWCSCTTMPGMSQTTGGSTSTPAHGYCTSFNSYHANGANMAFGDGHVVFITRNIDRDWNSQQLFRALCTRQDLYNHFGESTAGPTAGSSGNGDNQGPIDVGAIVSGAVY